MIKTIILTTLTTIFLLAMACGGSERYEPTAGPPGDQAPAAPAATEAPESRSQPVVATRRPAAPTKMGEAPPRATATPSFERDERVPSDQRPTIVGVFVPTVAPAQTPDVGATVTAQILDNRGGASRVVVINALDTSSPRGAEMVSAETEERRQPTATNFRDYGRLEFTETSTDNVSTFSLDIDRTSYNLALNWAENGYQVDPASVRAEEWINAFNYQYDPPESDRLFSMTTNIFRHPLDDNLHMARIGFQAPEIQETKPLNVTLVLDASGSMQEGNRVETARAAAETIRRSLSRNDRIAVVHFDTNVKHDHTVEHRRPDDRDVQRSIDRLQPGGSTNVQAGLNQGVRLADQARRDRPDAHNYVILMSDGVANVDATNPFAILEAVQDQDTSNPLRIITVGVGIENYNDVLLEQLAQYGNGWYRYLDDPEQAEATFARDNWLALSTPFADHTRAQITWDPDIVRKWRMVGYENRVTSDESFNEERREFAEIHSGASTTVFYELELRPDASNSFATRPMGTAELRWTAAGTSGAASQHHTFLAVPVREFDNQTSPLTRLGAIVALSSDLYSGLQDFSRQELSYLRTDFDILLDQLQELDSDLGHLQAYQDFQFLLRHIAADVSEMAPQTPSGTGSGYKP